MLRARLAAFFRRVPWVVALLQKVYRQLLPRFTVGASGIVFNSAGEVLLVEHIFHPKHPWGPPGGWVEAGEQPCETVEREMREEVGLVVKAGELVYVEYLPIRRHITFVYLCSADKHQVKVLSPELVSFAWYPIDDLPNVYPYILEAIQKASILRSAHPQVDQ